MKRKMMLSKAKVACGCATLVGASALTAITALAAEGDGTDVIGSVTSSLTTAIGNIASSVGSAIGSIIPIAIPLVGATLVVTIGLKVFKKVSNNG